MNLDYVASTLVKIAEDLVASVDTLGEFIGDKEIMNAVDEELGDYFGESDGRGNVRFYPLLETDSGESVQLEVKLRSTRGGISINVVVESDETGDDIAYEDMEFSLSQTPADVAEEIASRVDKIFRRN